MMDEKIRRTKLYQWSVRYLKATIILNHTPINTYLTLIRGINVGGNNIVPMAKLRDTCTQAGLSNVQTFIQSGNVIFESSETDTKELQLLFEKILREHFSVTTRVVVVARETYLDIIAHFPTVFARDGWKHNVMFVEAGTDISSIQSEFSGKDPGLEVSVYENVIFWSSNIEHRTADKYVKKLLTHPLYKTMTIRNDRTTRKIGELLK